MSLNTLLCVGRDPFRAALAILSDGAFKLFVWLCLRAVPSTGRLSASHAELARALGKSRRSIVSHLEELRSKGVCAVQPGANQHSPGSIEILDAF